MSRLLPENREGPEMDELALTSCCLTTASWSSNHMVKNNDRKQHILLQSLKHLQTAAFANNDPDPGIHSGTTLERITVIIGRPLNQRSTDTAELRETTWQQLFFFSRGQQGHISRTMPI